MAHLDASGAPVLLPAAVAGAKLWEGVQETHPHP